MQKQGRKKLQNYLHFSTRLIFHDGKGGRMSRVNGETPVRWVAPLSERGNPLTSLLPYTPQADVNTHARKLPKTVVPQASKGQHAISAVINAFYFVFTPPTCTTMAFFVTIYADINNCQWKYSSNTNSSWWLPQLLESFAVVKLQENLSDLARVWLGWQLVIRVVTYNWAM